MNEKIIVPSSGYGMLVVFFVLFGTSVFLLISGLVLVAFLTLLAAIVMSFGFCSINPNDSRVLVLFGEYKGTVKKNGLYWVNPFYTKKKISLRARNFDSERVKVNDKLGNPIMISVILVWKVSDTHKASFDVDNYESFVRVQSDSAVRKLAGLYPYDNFDDDQKEITLRSGLE